MTITLEEIITHWDSGDGKPYKGKLIDWGAYGGDGTTPPDDIGCMCAQGQVLCLMGGWSPKRLHETAQADADRETAKLLKISVAHAILLRRINDSVDGAPSIVITNPEKIIGDQAPVVLAFWKHIDRMSATAGITVLWPAWPAARATGEIQGAALMHERGQPFFFLPMFGFADPSEIPLS